MSSDSAENRTLDALADAGFADMRPVLRAVLRRIREKDTEAFAEATRRYQDDVESAIASGKVDPVEAWTAYGAWLVVRLGPGRFVHLDATGLATPCDPVAMRDRVLLFLPETNDQPVIPIARPAEPSLPQSTALDLLT